MKRKLIPAIMTFILLISIPLSVLAEKAAKNTPPKVIHSTYPVYPAEARKKHFEGTVNLAILILKDGTVSDVRVIESSGSDVLDKAASGAVKEWEFTPALKNGEPIDSWVIIKIVYKL